MKRRSFRVVSRDDITRLMDFPAYVDAISAGLRAHAAGRSLAPGVLHVPAQDGGFHVKAAGLTGERSFVAVKVNGNFPANRARHDLPTIQGAILLADAECGTPLALLDSAEITAQRTGAATALAARFGARPEACRAAICGCGRQGRIQLEALAHERRITEAFAWDADESAARELAVEMSARLAIPVHVSATAREAVRTADLIATCTPARAAYLGVADVRSGAFVAAVGADSAGKQELAPALLARARILTDSRDQAATMGDSQHAIRAGLMDRADIAAELGELLSGRAFGRTGDDEIVIFDSTGTALLDVAAASAVYERALAGGVGLECYLT